ncbi:peroxidase 30-like [Oryza glaberrima]|uniref:peroxidase 30-like n=1 Tax=Oryza glaberrima TaxID=4538 RepID=UPI00224C5AB4|nr:peroxidase 30-like [Oryza glaberrima]
MVTVGTRWWGAATVGSGGGGGGERRRRSGVAAAVEVGSSAAPLRQFAASCSATAAAWPGLQVGFYHAKFPVAEDVVLGEMRMILEEDPTLAPSLHRMYYHDCFVQGCDVSIMLRSRSGKGERDATPNRSMRGYDAINRIKARLESICPLTAVATAPHCRPRDS